MTAPRCACVVSGPSSGAGFPGGGFHVGAEYTPLGLPVGAASTPLIPSRSIPAWLEFPSVVFVPSVIQPRLLNERSPSLPTRLMSPREITAAWDPFGLVGPGV